VKQLATDSNKGESRQSVSHCQTWQEGGHTHTHTHTHRGGGGCSRHKQAKSIKPKNP
jgi:hypothetical protein